METFQQVGMFLGDTATQFLHDGPKPAARGIAIGGQVVEYTSPPVLAGFQHIARRGRDP